MGLIINKQIPMFMRGYPTVSDKYNVAGAVLAGNTPVQFGDLVKFSGTKGYFEAIGAADISAENAAKTIAGIVVATNVKLNTEWPQGGVEVAPNEAFNLLVNGFIAIELAEGAVENEIVANGPVHVTAGGKFTTPTGTGHITALTNVVFTGATELHGTTRFAEIYVK